MLNFVLPLAAEAQSAARGGRRHPDVGLSLHRDGPVPLRCSEGTARRDSKMAFGASGWTDAGMSSSSAGSPKISSGRLPALAQDLVRL
jgi:hypothetical protein